jgi:excinuclease ABC subunit A
VIKSADWIIDLGPEGGDRGGSIVAVGTPEDVASAPGTYTGEVLAPLLGIERSQARRAGRPKAPAAHKAAARAKPKATTTPTKTKAKTGKKAPARRVAAAAG